MLLPWNIFSMKFRVKSASNAYFLRHAAQMHQKCIKSATWGLQEALKTPPGRLKTDLASVLGANLRPSWSHVGHFFRPRRFHDASKTIQDAFKNPLERPRRPKRPPNLPRSSPDLDFGRFLIDNLSIFDWFMVHFWLLLGWFLIHFLSIFHIISRFKKQAMQHRKKWNESGWASRYVQNDGDSFYLK